MIEKGRGACESGCCGSCAPGVAQHGQVGAIKASIVRMTAEGDGGYRKSRASITDGGRRWHPSRRRYFVFPCSLFVVCVGANGACEAGSRGTHHESMNQVMSESHIDDLSAEREARCYRCMLICMAPTHPQPHETQTALLITCNVSQSGL